MAPSLQSQRALSVGGKDYQVVGQQQRSTSPVQASIRPSLAFNLRVNVAVIGGGITGVTAAYLLKQAGRTVALLERDRCGSGETGRTSAHLTAVPDRSLLSLVDTIGLDRTQAVWDAGFAAVSRVRAIVRDERINCGFAWVTGYLHGSPDDTAARARERIEQETQIARALGIDARCAEEVSGVGGPVLIFENQARLHPLRYLGVLCDRIDGDGSYVFEGTHVDAIDGDGPILVRSGPYRVTADSIVVATHAPLADAVGPHDRFAMRLTPMTTYAVSGVAPRGIVSEGLYWERRDGAYEHLRIDRHTDHDEVCLGGADHPAGAEGQRRWAN
jgi:glycine/D-amino acid oxidase-like deaminating enzyme